MSIDVSVVILTKNEEDNIRECIDSVKGWASEIIVVDDLSQDNTHKIASEIADKVILSYHLKGSINL